MLASRRVVIGPPGLGTFTGRVALSPTPDNSEMTATPTMLMAVKTLLASGAGWVNGAAAVISSARATCGATGCDFRSAERGMRPYYAFRQTDCVRADRGLTAD
jgi:hypothetical protein